MSDREPAPDGGQQMAAALRKLADQLESGRLKLTGTASISSVSIPPRRDEGFEDVGRQLLTVFFQAEKEVPSG